jgi:hypothetical protein
MIYLASIGITAAALYMLLTFSVAGSGFFEDFGEITGIAIAATMSFEILLFFGLTSIKMGLIPKPFVKYVKFLLKHLRGFHRSVGALALSILVLHFSVTVDLTNIFGYTQLTGFLTTAMVLMSVLAGLAFKLNRKLMNNIHVITTFAAILLFVLHILD